jgi:hypothetical protein
MAKFQRMSKPSWAESKPSGFRSMPGVNITSRYHICQRSAPSSIGVGDSDGPLMVTRGKRWYQIGVETFRPIDETEPSQMAGVMNESIIQNASLLMLSGYAQRVSAYCEWISGVTGGEAKCID